MEATPSSEPEVYSPGPFSKMQALPGETDLPEVVLEDPTLLATSPVLLICSRGH